MRPRAKDIHEDQNYDSFLDIVANLVGILVILIMVIGVRARQVAVSHSDAQPVLEQSASSQFETTLPDDLIVEIPDEPAQTIQTPTEMTDLASESVQSLAPEPVAPVVPDGPLASEVAMQMEQERVSAEKLHNDVHVIARQSEEVARLTAAKSEERNQMQLVISMAGKSLEKRRAALTDEERIRLASASELDAGKVELAELERQIASVQSAIGKPNVINHRSTPLAKTVFGKEEHFRLQGGRLAYVPVSPMTAKLKRDAQNKVWKLENADEVSELIGPESGFMMKYTLQRVKRRVDTPDGPRVARLIELKRFVMVPQSSSLGEVVDTALTENSQFARQLESMRSDETTVTVWTYPDSYGDFRRVKEYLYERGFTAAARPLPDGYPIGGSPEGSKSDAE